MGQAIFLSPGEPYEFRFSSLSFVGSVDVGPGTAVTTFDTYNLALTFGNPGSSGLIRTELFAQNSLTPFWTVEQQFNNWQANTPWNAGGGVVDPGWSNRAGSIRITMVSGPEAQLSWLDIGVSIPIGPRTLGRYEEVVIPEPSVFAMWLGCCLCGTMCRKIGGTFWRTKQTLNPMRQLTPADRSRHCGMPLSRRSCA